MMMMMTSILQNFTATGATVAEISVTKEGQKANIVPCHSNIWRVVKARC